MQNTKKIKLIEEINKQNERKIIQKMIKKPKGQNKQKQNTQYKVVIQKNIKKQLKNQKIHQNDDFICRICLDYICLSAFSKCGHIFCSQCIFEYMQLFPDCLVCQSNLRDTNLNYSVVFDHQIQAFLQKFDKNSLKSYEQRKKAIQEQNKTRNTSQLNVGELVDVRDQNYVWCVGVITRIFLKNVDSAQQDGEGEQMRVYLIKIKDCINNFDNELELQEDSDRLEKHGFFTSRSEFPHYSKTQSSNPFLKKVPQVQINGVQYYVQ